MLLEETTMCVEADEIFTDFVFELQRRMDKGQSTHLGKLDGWIATIWEMYFFPEQERKLYDYTNAARFINNVDPGAAEYKHENTASMQSAFRLTCNRMNLDISTSASVSQMGSLSLLALQVTVFCVSSIIPLLSSDGWMT